jgi:hypothetical protein
VWGQEVTYNQGNIRSFEGAIQHQKYFTSCPERAW